MSPRIKIGLLLDPGTRPTEIAKFAQFAETSGFYGIWTGDTPTTPHAPVILSLMVEYTKTIPVGYSLTNPYVRHVVKTAVSAATLDDSSKQRLIFTFGAGTLEGLRAIGKDWDRPVLHVREAMEVCRRLWKGETVSYSGDTIYMNNVRLYRPPLRSNIPIYIGCRRPLMIQLAGELAEGIILDNIPVKYSAFAKQQLEIGAHKGSRRLTPDNFCLSNMVTWSVSTNRNQAKENVKFLVPIDFITISNKEIEAAGLTPEEIVPIQKVLEQQTPNALSQAAKHVTNHMVDQFSVAGNPEDCIERIAEYEKAGFNLLIMALPTDERFKPWEALKLAKEEILPHFTD